MPSLAATPEAGSAPVQAGQTSNVSFPVNESVYEEGDTNAPVDLAADRLIHDEEEQLIVAIGNVELVQAGRILKADQISYSLRTEKVRATGNVVLNEIDGTTYFADDIEITRDLKEGFVEGLFILLADGSRFNAERGRRKDGTTLELKQARYTPCEPCKNNPEKAPLWQLRATDVIHDEADRRISYRNAWFEFKGVPVLYTPYFSHPDGSVEQKSGVLLPRFGYDSEQGASYQQEYYWAIAPDKDMTIGSRVYTGENPLMFGEYRQRFENAEIAVEGGGTYSSRNDSENGESVSVGDEWRGHLFGEGRWDINEKWRSGASFELTSDDQYLRQYDITGEDILENEIYAERFSGRNYFVGRALAFQDLRISSRAVDQPMVLPEIVASFYGAPNGLLGGRWSSEISALGLVRDGNGQDMARGTFQFGWQRKFITGFGLVNMFDAVARGDAYSVEGRTVSLPEDEGGSATKVRGFTQANFQTSYPLVKRFDSAQMVVEPLASITVANNIDFDDEIPNEDSQDFSLDATNLFEPNRFPGYDLIEDRSRVTYGVRTGLYGDAGNRGEIFLGQSRRLEDDDNPFYEGSGLEDQNSDYVGQLTTHLGGILDVDYRFQLENDNWSSQRHELDGMLTLGRLQFNTQYLYASAIQNTDLNESREQIRPAIRYRFADDWYATAAMRYDFSESNEGLRQASYGLDYIGQCLTFSLVTQRNLTSESSGDSGTEIMLRIGLKNLGEFETSGISIGGGDDSEDVEESGFDTP